MKKILVATVVWGAMSSFALPAFADDMAGMNMSAMKAPFSKPLAGVALTDAEIVGVNAAAGMVTLKHGELANVGMAAMTMAYKAKDAAMIRQVHAGEKVRVRVENVGGTLTIVKMVKVS